MPEIETLTRPVAAEMERCRELYGAWMTHSNALLHTVLQSLTTHQGKMLRPLLTLLSAKLFAAGAELPNQVILTSLAFEYFHNATLVHDDIVDESEERHGVPSVNKAYSNKSAVLVGDFMLANALSVCAEAEFPWLTRLVSQTSQTIVDGEILQLRSVFNQEISEEVYFHVIKAKTAALFSACAEAGARAMNASAEDVETLKKYGEFVGICFQIRDDIFDYLGGEHLGKPTGNDMKEGKLTLPLIRALFQTGDEEMLALAHRVKQEEISSDEIAVLVDFTVKNRGIDSAVKTMEEYAQRAKDLLQRFAEGPVRRSLSDFVDYAVQRTF